jgi:hypothetical protein
LSRYHSFYLYTLTSIKYKDLFHKQIFQVVAIVATMSVCLSVTTVAVNRQNYTAVYTHCALTVHLEMAICFYGSQQKLTLSNQIFLPPTYSPSLTYFGPKSCWWINCNYRTVLKRYKNINRKITTCVICCLMIFLFLTLFLMQYGF